MNRTRWQDKTATDEWWGSTAILPVGKDEDYYERVHADRRAAMAHAATREGWSVIGQFVTMRHPIYRLSRHEEVDTAVDRYAFIEELGREPTEQDEVYYLFHYMLKVHRGLDVDTPLRGLSLEHIVSAVALTSERVEIST